MSILSTIGRYASEYSAARTRYLTARAIRTLPNEVLKDIGWPDAYDARPTRSAGAGTWAGDR